MRFYRTCLCLIISGILVMSVTNCKARSTAKLKAADTADNEDAVNRLEEIVKIAASSPAGPSLENAKNDFFTLVKGLDQNKQLEPVLLQFVTKVKKSGKVAQLNTTSDADIASMVSQLSDSVSAEIMARDSQQARPEYYRSWDQVAQVFTAKLNSAGAAPSVATVDFEHQLERFLADVHFTAGTDVQIMRNGPASFGERDPLIRRMIEQAQGGQGKFKLWVFVWAIYDDETGNEALEQFVAAKKAGVDIRIIVDGLTSHRTRTTNNVAKLEQAGVPIIRWGQQGFPFHGMHRKILILDGVDGKKIAFCGGMNFGNDYSHKGPEDPPGLPKNRWRDTDLMITGAAVVQAEAMFKRVWNAFIDHPVTKGGADDQNFLFRGNHITDEIEAIPENSEGPRVAFLDQAPTNNGGLDPVYLTTLKAIEGAKKTVHISNAYYIDSPPIRAALLAALARNVKVAVHTNSVQSIDVPQIISPMMISLLPLASYTANPAEVYLHSGPSTLHSKYLVVDGAFGWVGSYNLHPRSYRYEGEAVLAFRDAANGGLGQQIESMFANDIDTQFIIEETGRPNSQKVDAAELKDLIKDTSSPVADIYTKFIYDQL